MNTNHTPGPWQASGIEECGGYDCMTSAIDITQRGTGLLIAELDLRHYGQKPCSDIPSGAAPVAEANARLIAAAPELLASLQRIVDWIDMGYDPSEKSIEAARALIERVTGERTTAS